VPVPALPEPAPAPAGPNPAVVTMANRFVENVRKMVDDVQSFPVIDDDNKLDDLS
jgi:hypothetical protein